MKLITFLFLFLASQLLYAQVIEQFSDSLVLNDQRTWVGEGSQDFTNIGVSCNYGVEMTFYKKNEKVDLLICDGGEWKKNNYNYEIIRKDNEYMIHLFKWEYSFFFFRKKIPSKRFKIQAQMILNDGKTFTILNLLILNKKMTYKLYGE